MQISELAMVAAITVSIGGVSYAALNLPQAKATTQRTADAASCRTVDEAILGYIALNDATPTSTAQLKSFVNGDISQYRIVDGRAAGPGCSIR